MYGVFDIVGPIMIGPSSSHTAGAVRLGLLARKILGSEPRNVHLKFNGSFAETYKGHGTDKAVIAGLLGFAPDDLRIRDSLKIAAQRGLQYTISKIDDNELHPNAVIFKLDDGSGRSLELIGASIGGGSVLITDIDGYEVELSGKYETLIISHLDKSGVIAGVTQTLAEADINIAYMRVSRKRKGEEALMIIEVDGSIPAWMDEAVRSVPGVVDSFSI